MEAQATQSSVGNIENNTETNTSSWLSEDRLAVVGVVVCFVFMIAGGIAERLGNYDTLSHILFAISFIGGGAFGLKASIEALKEHTVEIDLLMILAALGAASIGAIFEGAMLLFLFSLSNVLQTYAIGRSRDAIKSLMKLRPREALTRRGDKTVVLPIEQLVVGDQIIVRPGERIPMDGVVIEGESAVDQAAVTGESMPVTRRVGDKVFASTINQSGGLEVRVTQLAADSTIARLIKMVETAQGQKAHTQRMLDKFEQYYAMGVIVFTLLLIVVPQLLFNTSFHDSFYRAMTVMVGASPCALVISTPASILSAIANGARRGILFKGGAYLEEAANIKVVCFDKTGTLTEGKPTVTDVKVIPLFVDQAAPDEQSASNENILLALAAALEAKSEHPLGMAIVAAAKARNLHLLQVSGFKSTLGRGVSGRVEFRNGLDLRIGNIPMFDDLRMTGMDAAKTRMAELQDEGKTAVIVAKINDDGTGNVLGVIAIADVLRPDAAESIRQLKAAGVKRVVMITGDNARVAKAIARQAGVDEVYADLLPEDKVKIVKEQAVYGPVAMVGDGVNDAPALATANIGVAMGAAGTDVALETADMVLMANDLSKIPYAIGLSKKARTVVFQNLAFAGAVIVVLILTGLGLALPLPLAVIGHEGSTVLVCLNGLRLLRYKG